MCKSPRAIHCGEMRYKGMGHRSHPTLSHSRIGCSTTWTQLSQCVAQFKHLLAMWLCDLGKFFSSLSLLFTQWQMEQLSLRCFTGEEKISRGVGLQLLHSRQHMAVCWQRYHISEGRHTLVTGLLSWKIGTALAPPWHDQDLELNSGRTGWHLAAAGVSLAQVAGAGACWSLCKIRRLK